MGSTPSNIEEAAHWYFRSAQQGNTSAMVKLADIQFSSGFNEAAISWLTLAARWNDSTARHNLHQRGLNVPYPDLYEQQQINEAIAMQYYANIISSLPNAYSEGYNQRKNAISNSYQTNNNPLQSNNFRFSQPSETFQASGCTSDYSCGIGFQCVKAPLKSQGVCMKSVNEYNVPQYNLPNTNSFGPNMNLSGQCTLHLDCPPGFLCDPELRACIKI